MKKEITGDDVEKSLMDTATQSCRRMITASGFLGSFLQAFATAVEEGGDSGGSAPRGVYLVGGCVRDLFLSCLLPDRPVKDSDIDIVVTGYTETTALVAAVESVRHVVPLRGVQHVIGDFPVVKVFPAGWRGCLDIALARTGEMSTGPGHRDFRFTTRDVSIEDDLRRRDFTINAIALRIIVAAGALEYEIVDVTGGIDDLLKRRIAAIGDAERRYREDPIRQVRAVRFAAELSDAGFRLAEGTYEAIKSVYPETYRDISREPFVCEVDKALTANFPFAYKQLSRSGILSTSLPFLDGWGPKDRECVAAMIESLAGDEHAPSVWVPVLLWAVRDDAEGTFRDGEVRLPRNFHVPSFTDHVRIMKLPRLIAHQVRLLAIMRYHGAFLWPMAAFEDAYKRVPKRQRSSFMAMLKTFMTCDGFNPAEIDGLVRRLQDAPVPPSRDDGTRFFSEHDIAAGSLRAEMMFHARDCQLREGGTKGDFFRNALSWHDKRETERSAEKKR